VRNREGLDLESGGFDFNVGEDETSAAVINIRLGENIQEKKLPNGWAPLIVPVSIAV